MTTPSPSSDVPLAMPLDAKCLNCGYSLRGLQTDACPECGRAFNPADPATYKRIARKRRWWVRHARPPGRVHVGFAVLSTVFVLVALSSPGKEMFDPLLFAFGMSAMSLWIGLPIDYVLRLVAAWRRNRLRAWRSARWLVLPTCLALFVVTVQWPWPLWIRFETSRQAFEQAVAASEEWNVRRLVGTYEIKRVERLPDGSLFFETASDFGDRHGFLYSPPGPPVMGPRWFLGHDLGQGWFTASFWF